MRILWRGCGVVLRAGPAGSHVAYQALLIEEFARLHLDVMPTDRSRDEEVERLKGIGATVHEDHRKPDGPHTPLRHVFEVRAWTGIMARGNRPADLG